MIKSCVLSPVEQTRKAPFRDHPYPLKYLSVDVGFKEKEEGKVGTKKSSTLESDASRHARTHSDGNNSYGPPNGKHSSSNNSYGPPKGKHNSSINSYESTKGKHYKMDSDA